MTYYFAYGSNLLLAQMRERCPAATPEGPATLEGRALAFCGFSGRWGGGVAHLEPSESTAQGALYRVSDACLRSLDGFESVPDVYTRVTVGVRSGNREVEAVTYLLHSTTPAALPSRRYLATIAGGYLDHGLPEVPLHPWTLALITPPPEQVSTALRALLKQEAIRLSTAVELP